MYTKESLEFQSFLFYSFPFKSNTNIPARHFKAVIDVPAVHSIEPIMVKKLACPLGHYITVKAAKGRWCCGSRMLVGSSAENHLQSDWLKSERRTQVCTPDYLCGETTSLPFLSHSRCSNNPGEILLICDPLTSEAFPAFVARTQQLKTINKWSCIFLENPVPWVLIKHPPPREKPVCLLYMNDVNTLTQIRTRAHSDTARRYNSLQSIS